MGAPQTPFLDSSLRTSDVRCRCGALLARTRLPHVVVRFDPAEVCLGVEIRCRRCKAMAVLVPGSTGVDDAHDALRAAE